MLFKNTFVLILKDLKFVESFSQLGSARILLLNNIAHKYRITYQNNICLKYFSEKYVVLM